MRGQLARHALGGGGGVGLYRDLHVLVELRDVDTFGVLRRGLRERRVVIRLGFRVRRALDDVVSELRFDESRDLAGLQRRDGVAERFTMSPRWKAAEAAATLRRAGVLAVRLAIAAKFAAVTCGRTLAPSS